jgi:hypothetical protein
MCLSSCRYARQREIRASRADSVDTKLNSIAEAAMFVK